LLDYQFDIFLTFDVFNFYLDKYKQYTTLNVMIYDCIKLKNDACYFFLCLKNSEMHLHY